VQLHSNFKKLQYKLGFNKGKFVAEFKRFLKDYKLQGTTLANEFKASKFLGKIVGIHNTASPFFTFYNSLVDLPQDQITFELVKERFIAIDTAASIPSLNCKFYTDAIIH
jgi:hypothetical protein